MCDLKAPCGQGPHPLDGTGEVRVHQGMLAAVWGQSLA